MDYYDILGISRGANEQDIKKAYRKLAMKWHPDKNTDQEDEAREMFLEIAEAYDVLCHKEKKAIFDQYGYEGLTEGMPNEGGMQEGYSFKTDSATAIFTHFFGSDNPFVDFGFGNAMPFESTLKKKELPKCADLEVPLHITLDDVFTGRVVKVAVTRNRAHNQEGTKHEKTFNIKVKSEWVHGSRVTYAGEGDDVAGKTVGDVVFIVAMKEHANFVRKGSDLMYTAKIKLVDALTDFVLEVATLDGRKIAIACNEVISQHTEKTIEGEGFVKQDGKRGVLKLKFDITFPKHLTELQKKSLVKLLT